MDVGAATSIESNYLPGICDLAARTQSCFPVIGHLRSIIYPGMLPVDSTYVPGNPSGPGDTNVGTQVQTAVWNREYGGQGQTIPTQNRKTTTVLM